MTTLTKDHNNHPAHSPLTSRRLHQMRDILSKAAEQRNGGDIGYAMSDAVKLIDEVLASEPVAAFEATFPRENPDIIDECVPIQDEETSQMRESLDARYKTMLEAAPQPSPVVNADLVSFDDLRDAVAEMTGGPAMQWGDIYKGHQAVPFINFNSLARIVDKFRAAPTSPVVPDEIDVNDPALDTHRKWMAEGWNRCRTAMLNHSVESNEKAKPVMFIDGNISPEDAEKLIAAIEEFNREPRDAQVMIAEHVSETHKLNGVIDENLIEALRLIQCMLDDYRDNNYGHAQSWVRHIDKRMGDYSDVHGDDAYSLLRDLLPAAPQQEVNRG